MTRTPIRFGRVSEPFWDEKPVAILGGGPSLRGFDFERLKGRFHVLAVNGTIFDVPWAAAGFSLDRLAMREWWPRFCAEVQMPLHFAVPNPWLLNIEGTPAPNMLFYRRVARASFIKNRGEIASGGTSGFGAVNLAWLKGARKIVLFGFDYGATEGGWHHNPQHYAFEYRQVDANWQKWARNFHNVARRLTAEKVEVINASPLSRITAFPKMTIDEVLS